MSSNEPVSVRVLDREYTVGVQADEHDSLLAAARLLDARLRELRGGNRMVALDRLAVLAALNLAHELLQLRQHGERLDRDLERALDRLHRRLDAVPDLPR